jgi:hypothetical protein
MPPLRHTPTCDGVWSNKGWLHLHLRGATAQTTVINHCQTVIFVLWSSSFWTTDSTVTDCQSLVIKQQHLFKFNINVHVWLKRVWRFLAEIIYIIYSIFFAGDVGILQRDSLMLTFRSSENLDRERRGGKMGRETMVTVFWGVKWKSKCVIW